MAEDTTPEDMKAEDTTARGAGTGGSGDVRSIRPAPDWEQAWTNGDAEIHLRHTLTSHLRPSYPVGARDWEVMVASGDADGVRALVGHVFATDAQCRRVILPVDPEDADGAARAGAAGFREVVEVELADGSDLVLWVAEPQWVLDQPTAIELMPQT